MMAESGTFDIRHRILESCVSRAAGHRPAVVKDMATARLSVVAVRALVKKMKGKKRDLDVTERKDLMILERKLRVSEAYQNGYFGMPLKVGLNMLASCSVSTKLTIFSERHRDCLQTHEGS